MIHISVIVPVYNADKYLKRCVNSILSQAYKEIEIILINDGSTDDSHTICEGFNNKHENIVYISQKNQGPAAARNTGIKIAKGEYIGFVDSDDFIDENMFFDLLDIAVNEKIDVVISNFKIISHNGGVSILKGDLPVNKKLQVDEIKQHILSKYYSSNLSIIPSLWNKIYRSDFIKNNKLLLDENRVRAEDYWFNFYVFKKAISVYVVDKAYYNYYAATTSSVMKTFRENQFNLFLKTRKELLKQNIELKFEINEQDYNSMFIDNTNEYILQAIKVKGFVRTYSFVKNIIINSEFNSAFASIKVDKTHTKLIKVFLAHRCLFCSYLGYYAWSLKVK